MCIRDSLMVDDIDTCKGLLLFEFFVAKAVVTFNGLGLSNTSVADENSTLSPSQFTPRNSTKRNTRYLMYYTGSLLA